MAKGSMEHKRGASGPKKHNPKMIHIQFTLWVKWFVSRKSLPCLMLSDNASTFESELRKLFNSRELMKALSTRGVRLQFIFLGMGDFGRG